MSAVIVTATPDKGEDRMAVIIPFPKPKQEPTPAWRQDLMKLFWDERNWFVFPDGSKRLALTPGRYVSVVSVVTAYVWSDDGEHIDKVERGWRFYLHGDQRADVVWGKRKDAEQAAWQALVRVEEKRMLKREKQRG
jgi:hypothetical protein